ncbi:MAG: glycerophosphodiester phosphodiesterase family protein, partial [Cloacibacterium sp.]
MKKLILLATLIGANFYHAQTQVIAHRGFWKTNPTTAENSIAALKNAQQLKVYGSEFDVRMTKDGVLVINHDEHINGVEIAAMDFKSLKKQKLSNGENLSTLEKYLKQGKKSAVKLILEIKPAKTPELETEMVEKTLAMVEKF